MAFQNPYPGMKAGDIIHEHLVSQRDEYNEDQRNSNMIFETRDSQPSQRLPEYPDDDFYNRDSYRGPIINSNLSFGTFTSEANVRYSELF